jgi:sugar lactone lactonase YvrE
MSSRPLTPTPRVLLSGLAYVESPRWHDGRLWFAHWGAGEVVAVDLDGNSEVMAEGPPGLGWSIDWLPDGRLLTTGPELRRQEPDGSMVTHADLSGVADHGWNEIVVDGRGNVYLNGFGFDFLGGGAPKPGIIALLTPDGTARQVAGGLEFPNGMVVTPDNSTLVVAESFARRLTAFDIAADGSLSNRRVWAEGVGPDGICLDADGAIWTHAAEPEPGGESDTEPGAGADAEATGQADACLRVREGGEVLARIELDRAGFACMLGGPDRRTLFMLAADWRGVENVDAALADRTGQVLVADAPAPGAGWP